VCYAHEDAGIGYPEIVRLRDSGFHIWYDEGIAPGSEWSQEIADHIESCAVFLYFLTPQAVEREHCHREVNFALEQQCSMLAVHLTETQVPSVLKLSLSNRQAIMRYELSATRYREKLDAAINHAAAGRSADEEAVGAGLLQVGEWLVEAGSGTLRKGETEAHLPPQTMAVLVYLARHAGEVVSSEELLANVWQGRVIGDDSVYQHIGRIRKALGDSSRKPTYIETIPRRGVRMIAEVAIYSSLVRSPSPAHATNFSP
jgi:DNA-binding winged helix-turn-helix (wHTH) protein